MTTIFLVLIALVLLFNAIMLSAAFAFLLMVAYVFWNEQGRPALGLTKPVEDLLPFGLFKRWVNDAGETEYLPASEVDALKKARKEIADRDLDEQLSAYADGMPGPLGNYRK